MSDTPGNNKTTFNDVYGKTGQEYTRTDREAIGAIITSYKGYATEQDIDDYINGK